MYERFTDRARKTMAIANQEARRLNHECIGTEHILLGFIKEGTGVGAVTLRQELGVSLANLREDVLARVKAGEWADTSERLPMTPHAKKVIEYAIEEARNLGHNYVGTEHLLLGMLREDGGVAAKVLAAAGVTLERAREGVLKLVKRGESPAT